MTAARWASLIIGLLCFPLHFDSGPNPPNGWDSLNVLIYKAAAAALIIVPLLLEYKERRNRKGD